MAYVAASNVNRRHMTTGARAMAVAVMLADAGRRGEGRWDYGAVPEASEEGKVSQFETWRKAMGKAGLVIDHAPDLAPLVVSGAHTLHAAHGTAVERRDEASTDA